MRMGESSKMEVVTVTTRAKDHIWVAAINNLNLTGTQHILIKEEQPTQVAETWVVTDHKS